MRLPLPPGCLPTVWGDEQRCVIAIESLSSYYCSGDGGYIDNDGYVFIMGRTDDVINVAVPVCRPAKWKKFWRPIRQ